MVDCKESHGTGSNMILSAAGFSLCSLTFDSIKVVIVLVNLLVNFWGSQKG